MTDAQGPVAAIVPAAGGGSRFGGAKLFAELGGRPVISWTLAALGDPGSGVDELIIAARAPDHARLAQVALTVAPRLRLTLVEGGARRQDSVRSGLNACRGPIVVVHDAARPGVRPALVAAVIAAARRTGAATCALGAVDTTALTDGDRLAAILDRDRVVAVQTPQAFRTDWLVAGHVAAAAAGRRADDDATLVLAIGHPVDVVAGDPRNRKLTAAEDLEPLRLALQPRAAS